MRDFGIEDNLLLSLSDIPKYRTALADLFQNISIKGRKPQSPFGEEKIFCSPPAVVQASFLSYSGQYNILR
jgi:hypothetical protein